MLSLHVCALIADFSSRCSTTRTPRGVWVLQNFAIVITNSSSLIDYFCLLLDKRRMLSVRNAHGCKLGLSPYLSCSAISLCDFLDLVFVVVPVCLLVFCRSALLSHFCSSFFMKLLSWGIARWHLSLVFLFSKACIILSHIPAVFTSSFFST